MSSKYVRDQVKAFLLAQYPTMKLVDISSEYMDVRDIMAEDGIGPKDTWVGIQFVGDVERPMTIPATNTQGKYRETGGFFLHIVEPVSRSAFDNILTRSEDLISKFRGMRIGNVIIQEIGPLNTAKGTTLEFNGGYVSGSIFPTYYSDKDL